jgi:hypothetical protein
MLLISANTFMRFLLNLHLNPYAYNYIIVIINISIRTSHHSSTRFTCQGISLASFCVCMYVCLFVYVCMCVCVCGCMCVCVWVYLCVCTYCTVMAVLVEEITDSATQFHRLLFPTTPSILQSLRYKQFSHTNCVDYRTLACHADSRTVPYSWRF